MSWPMKVQFLNDDGSVMREWVGEMAQLNANKMIDGKKHFSVLMKDFKEVEVKKESTP